MGTLLTLLDLRIRSIPEHIIVVTGSWMASTWECITDITALWDGVDFEVNC